MKLVHIFFDVSMSNGHDGLKKLMAKEKRELTEDQYAVFVNKDWMAMKMLTPANVLLHYKARARNMPINPNTIKHLPDCVKGGKLDYTAALTTVINKQYSEKFKK